MLIVGVNRLYEIPQPDTEAAAITDTSNVITLEDTSRSDFKSSIDSETQYTNKITIITVGRRDNTDNEPESDSDKEDKVIIEIEDTENSKETEEAEETQKTNTVETSTETAQKKMYAVSETSQISGSTVIYTMHYYPTAKDLRQSTQENETFFTHGNIDG